MAVPIEKTLVSTLEALNINFPLKEKQTHCLKLLSGGSDVFAVLPTGYGRSIIYSVLPKLWRVIEDNHASSSCIVMIVSPLVSLMKDQVENISKLGVDSIYLGESHTEGMQAICMHVSYILFLTYTRFFYPLNCKSLLHKGNMNAHKTE